MLDNDRARQTIVAETGGWHWLHRLRQQDALFREHFDK
jgi:hypothetical protein